MDGCCDMGDGWSTDFEVDPYASSYNDSTQSADYTDYTDYTDYETSAYDAGTTYEAGPYAEVSYDAPAQQDGTEWTSVDGGNFGAQDFTLASLAAADVTPAGMEMTSSNAGEFANMPSPLSTVTVADGEFDHPVLPGFSDTWTPSGSNGALVGGPSNVSASDTNNPWDLPPGTDYAPGGYTNDVGDFNTSYLNLP